MHVRGVVVLERRGIWQDEYIGAERFHLSGDFFRIPCGITGGQIDKTFNANDNRIIVSDGFSQAGADSDVNILRCKST